MNMKKIKKSVKKSTKNNYRIEALEPRLMMSADPVIDVDDLSNLSTQFETISDRVFDETTSLFNTFCVIDTELDNLNIVDRVNNGVNSIKDLVEDSLATAKGTLQNLLGEASTYIKGEVDNFNDNIAAQAESTQSAITQISLKDFATKYLKDFVNAHPEYKDFTFNYTDSKLVVEYDLETVKEIGSLEIIAGGETFNLTGDGTNLAVNASISAEIELDADVSGTMLDNVSDIGSPAVAAKSLDVSIANLGLNAEFLGFGITEVDNDSTPDLKISYNAEQETPSASVDVDLEFSLSPANADSLPFMFKEGEMLKISKVGTDFELKIPDIVKNESFTLADFAGSLKNIELDKLPFLKSHASELKNALDKITELENYWAKVSMAFGGAVEKVEGETDAFQLKINQLASWLGKFVGDKADEMKENVKQISLATLNGGNVGSLVNVFDGITDFTSATDTLGLKTGDNTLRLFLTANSGTLEKLNLNLIELEDLLMEATIELDVTINVSSEGKVSFGSVAVGDFTASITKKESVTKELDLGLFTASIENLNAKYEIKVDSANGSKVTSTLELSCGQLSLKSGSIDIFGPVADQNISYNFSEDIWIFPEAIKKYTSLTGDTLVNQVAIYLDTVQTALRGLIEKNVKLDFLGGSTDTIVNIVDKVEKVVFGEKGLDSLGKIDDSLVKVGLLKYVDGAYTKNFADFADFQKVFNYSWAHFVLGKDLNQIETVLKSTDMEIQKSLDFLDIALIDINDKELVQKIESDVEEEVAAEVADATEVALLDHCKLTFNLGFNFAKVFDLNFENTLKSGGLVGVSTNGFATASGNAGMSFTLDIHFSSETIGEDTELPASIERENSSYSIFSLPEEYTLDSELTFNVINKDDKSELATIKGLEKYGISGTSTWTVIPEGTSGKNVKIFATSSKDRLLITSDFKFELKSGKDVNAFSELRLTSSNLQTTFLAENVSEDGKIKIYVSKQDPSASPTSAGNPVEIEIDLAEIMGGDFYKEILWESDLKGRLNEFFSLQKSDGIPLLEVKDSIIGSGRSVMNTFGLYVVDSTYNSDTKKYSIRFGCDPKRLQDYVQGDNGDPSGLYYELCDAEGSNVTYMRISGEIKPNATLGEAGILIGKDTFFPTEMVYTLYETATERDNVLSDFRKNHPILESVLTYTSFDVEDANDASKTKYGVSVSGTDVTISNSVAQLVISKTEGDSTTSDTYIVNTENCHNLSSLANAIRDAYVSGIKDVQVIDSKLVFTTDVDVTVTLEGTPLDAEKGDFKIKGHDPIDFQDLKKGTEELTLDDSTTIYDIVAAVNQELDGSDVSLYYNDSEGNALDHLEFRSANPFSLENIGASTVLQGLGFVAGEARADSNGEYRIVGATLTGPDWSKLFSLESIEDAKIKLSADATFQIGADVSFFKDPVASGDNYKITLSEESAQYPIDEGGLLMVGSDFYRVLGVESEEVSGKTYKVIIVSKGAVNAEGSDFVATKDSVATYVASANASVGFLGVDAAVDGSIRVSAEMNLKKDSAATETSSDKDAITGNILGFDYEMTFDVTSADTEEETDADVPKFELMAWSSIGDKTYKVASGDVSLRKPVDGVPNSPSTTVGPYAVTSSFNLDDGFSQMVGDLKSISVEQIFTVLENVIKRVTDILDKTNDVKIPVINKSVGDLVNVANDLRDIVSKLRQEKVTNFQQLVKLLKAQLEDFGLTAYEGASGAVKDLIGLDVVPVEEDEITKYQLAIDFNIDKGFKDSYEFNFGNGTVGVNGSAALEVQGDFWFTLGAKINLSSTSIDLSLENAIQFGANVEILGDKLSFNLGVDGLSDSAAGAFLKNLITVGAKDNTAYVYGKAELLGSYGNSGLSVTSFDALHTPFNFALPAVVLGKLPVSVCGVDMGEIKLGEWTNSVNCPDSADEAKNGLTSIFDVFKNAWLATANGSGDAASLTTARNDLNAKAIIIEKGTLAESSSKSNFDFDLYTGSNDDVPSNGSLVADISGVYDKIIEYSNFGTMDWFEKIKLVVGALNNMLDSLEGNLNGNLASTMKSMPVIGDALSNGVDFLSVLKKKVLEPLSNYLYESTGLTAELLAQKLDSLFSGYFDEETFALLPPVDNNDLWKRSKQGTWYRSGDGFAEWYLNLGQVYSLGRNIDLNLGLPGLGLETNGGVSISLDWNLQFGFGVSQENGFYFIFDDGNELDVTAQASLNGKVIGKLAGLGLELDASDADAAKIKLSLGVDLGGNGGEADVGNGLLLDETEKAAYDAKSNESEKKEYLETLRAEDGRKLANLSTVNVAQALSMPVFSYDASVNLNLGLMVGIASDLKISDESTPKFPNITGMFVFSWAYGSASESTDNAIQRLGFQNLEFDMGSFIGGVLGPIVSKIQKVVEPLEPLIEFLTTPFPVLDDLGIEITPLDLAKKFGNAESFDDSMVYAIKDLIAMSKKLSVAKGKSLKLQLGNFNLIDRDSGLDTSNKTSEDFLKGSTSNRTVFDDLGSYADKANDASVTNQANSMMAANGFNKSEKDGKSAWKFIWDEPSKIFQLLLGNDVPLVEYDMPALRFDFNWDTFVRIWGPLGVRLGVSFNASIDLAFGYDTLGIRQWVGGGYKDFGSLLNGFYVNDLDKNGNDINELSFYGGVKASAELNAGVSAGVGGGVGIDVGFNLYDPNKDGKIRLNEIATLFKEEGLFGFFDVNGKITAKLYAYVDLWLTKKEWNITDDITLFSFEYTHSTPPVMASEANGDVVANIGPNSTSRVATDDINPSLDDGDETLNLYLDDSSVYKESDKEKKYGSIKENDGKLLVDAGAGNDRITLFGNFNRNIEINGGDGDDFIDLSGLTINGDHSVIIWGGAGNDTIIGAAGLNIIFGDMGVARIEEKEEEDGNKSYKYVAEANVDANVAGQDTIYGGSNRDIIFGGAGIDQINGGTGNDLIFGDGGRVLFDGADNWASVDGNDKTTYDYTKIFGDVKTNSAAIDRTDISLDGANDVLIGGAGDDAIYGGGGHDYIDGAAGEDTLDGGKGNDRILGGSDSDNISGGEGMDMIFGDRFADSGAEFLFNFVAPFTAESFSEDFKAAYDVTNQKINAKSFDINLDEDKGRGINKNKYKVNLTKILSDAVKKVYVADTTTTRATDYISGNDGDDLIFGDGGAHDGETDYIEGGIGNDLIDGDGGNDTINGGIDNDVIYGGAGDDIIDGGAGNDSLYGDEGFTAYGEKEGFETLADGSVTPTDPAGIKEYIDNKLAFGDNLGIGKKLYTNAKSTTTESGNDKIVTGPGMDFVDGQDGSDKIIVNLMGESVTSYANVTDSGVNGSDSLTVEGTEVDDDLLMRMNKTHKLGFVALLPDTLNQLEGEQKTADDLSKNTNIERVNFTNAMDVVNLNGNGGKDTIRIDGTAKVTNVDGGAGSDTIQVGQLYNSERNDQSSAVVTVNDAFDTVKTSEEKYLSDGVTDNTTLNVDGGLDEDFLLTLGNKGRLNMAGGKGDDAFVIASYSVEDPDNMVEGPDGVKTPKLVAIKKGPVSIDGGDGNDSLLIGGTNGDDSIVVSKEGVLSNVVGVKAAGVEKTTFDAGAGDDIFDVVSSNANDATIINGGKGNDTVVAGGLQESMTLYSAETDGQSCFVKYEVFEPAEEGKDEKVLESHSDKFVVIDTSLNTPAVFISGDAQTITDPQISISEGSAKTFYLRASNIAEGETVKVQLMAPMVSSNDFMRGDRGLLIAACVGSKLYNGTVKFDSTGAVIEGSDSNCVSGYGETIDLYLDASHTSVEISVFALNDLFVESEASKSISISSAQVNAAGEVVKELSKSMTVAPVKVVSDSGARDTINLLTYAEEFSGSASVSLPKGLGSKVAAVYAAGVNNALTLGTDYSVDIDTLNIKTATYIGKKIMVLFRGSNMRIDGAKATLVYDDLSQLDVQFTDEAGSQKTVLAEGAVRPAGVTALEGVYYRLEGNTIVFFNSGNKRLMTLHGTLSVSLKTSAPAAPAGVAASGTTSTPTGSIPNEVVTGETQQVSVPAISIAEHSSMLVETEGENEPNSVTYAVTCNKDIAEGETLTVRISAIDAVSDMGEDPTQQLTIGAVIPEEVLAALVAENSDFKSDDFIAKDSANSKYVILTFTSKIKSFNITVTAKADDVSETYGVTTVMEGDNLIGDIDGAVYAYGEGSSMDISTDSPSLLRYNHRIEPDDESEQVGVASEQAELKYIVASKYNEKNEYPSDALKAIGNLDAKTLTVALTAIDPEADAEGYKFEEGKYKGKTVRFVANDSENGIKVGENENAKESEWFRINECKLSEGNIVLTLNKAVVGFDAANSMVLFSTPKDYLFVDEKTCVDRIFVNNQSASRDANSTFEAFATKLAEMNFDPTKTYTSEEVAQIAAELGLVGMDAENVLSFFKNVSETEGSMNKDPNALRFTHTEIGKRGISVSDFEFGEYNLGTGSDTVNISKTLHREDGFQTFTVVNTGDINSAKSNTVGEVIGTATFSASSVSAAGLFHYDIAVDTGVTFEKTAEDTRIYYVDAEIVKTENGETEVVGTQRREIVGVFDCISGFDVKDDFILRDGESIAGFTFIQAKFDDIINVNSYKEDVASTVIAESVVVDLDEEETDESPATETEESDTEETVVMDGFAYNYTIKDEYAATIEASVAAATEAGKSIYVDAKLSDGTTQRRLVVAGSLTSSSFRTDRAFTLPSDDSIYIKSFSFGYGYVGDGQLVVNAESGNDQIFGVNPDVTRNDMVLFGGKGADYINVSQGGIAFGDMGVVEYASLTKADEFTTRLGYELIDDEPETIHTTIAKDASGKLDKQTDGIRRNATNVRSVADDIGDIDMITLGGTDSNVIGGAKGDVLSVSGNMNVVLGDSGSVQYDAGNLENAVYGDSVGKGLHIVETTSDDIGGVDNISISGGKNIAMGGFAGDDIRITGADNIAAGDGGKLEVFEKRQVLETTSDELGGEDFITTGDGANVVLGGTTHDVIHTGAGNDTIVGDGGKVVMDLNRNALLVTNEGHDIPVLEGEGENAALKSSAGKDRIDAGDGDNVVMGGLDNDTIDTGTGKDVVFGDNAYATFRGNASEAQNQLDELQNIPTIYDESTLSFNFQGPAQTGVAANEQAGAVADYTFSQMDETTGEFVDVTEHADYRVGNWNNIKNPSGIEAGTYGNEDDEIVLFDNGSRASAVSVTYGATEAHRIDTTTGQQIRLHGYDQSNMVHGSDPGDVNLMKSGLDTSRNNDQTKLLVQVDGLSQYFTDYDVVVYLDMVRENSWSPDSVRMVTLYRDYVDKNGVSHSDVAGCYFVNDPESNTFNGNWIVATATTAEQARNARDTAGNPVYANCVIFKGISGDRFHVEITDGDPSNGQNGKDRAGIAGIQVRGRHHKQDVAASTDIAYGGNDTVRTSGGDDIVVGGTGNDQINTYGDEHYGINDNDVVFGDNAKMLFTDRDDAATTASTITTAESVISTDMSATYDDTILTGDGDDTVVGGLGVDKIDASATPTADGTLDGVDVVSLNFVDISTPESLLMRQGESAGVVVDSNWHNVYQAGSQQREFGQDPTDVHFRYHINGNNDAPTEKVNASMDADTGNNKMFKTYVCGQAHDTLTLELSNIPASESDPRDVYVYISGIDNERDGYDYIFKITGSNGQTYFLNDWMGDCFDGEYKQVTCTSYQKGALASGITPNVTMIGNYVVFRNVKASSLTVSISRYDSTMGDAKWNNIPVFSGVQIVKSSLPTEAIEVGGDHDKDLVFGDEARLHFDLDIPFAGDENIVDYRNRVITSESIAMTDGNVAKGAGDTIVTGKDRDVVVGGEGIDEVYSGAGDDVVIGDRASLKVEHNNPVGVFSQNVEIVLEDNDYTKAQRRRFVDGDTGMSVNEMQDQVRQGRIEGIALETAGDTGDHVYDESSKNLVFNGNLTATGFEVPDIEFAGSETAPDDGNNQTEPDDNNTQPLDGETGNGETGNGQGGETGDGETGNGQGGETGDGETGNGQGDEPGITTIESYDMQTPLFLTAGETVKVVFHEFYRDTNYVPNLNLIFIGSQGRFPAIDVDLETATGPLHLDIPSTWWYSVDVPDQPNGENGCFEIYFRAEEDTVVVVSIAQ